MKLLAILHARFESLGAIETWANQQGHDITYCQPYRGDALPSPTDFDFVVVMGGPQSPMELEQSPYLADEITFIEGAIAEQKPILGVCLGAQLMGEALGAPTEKSPHKEIGTFPIQLTEAGRADPIFREFPETFTVMHWHSDMPGLPASATVLAASEGFPRQVIRFGKNLYGLQCHMEHTPELLDAMVTHCPQDLADENETRPYIQDAQSILAADCKTMNDYLFTVLDKLSQS